MKFERLTERTKDCFGYRLKDGSDAEVGFFKDYNAFYSHMMVVKALGEYEDLEEQGRLLKLPCEVGDTVYEIIDDNIPTYKAYIQAYEVQDISTKEIKYCDDWIPLDYDNLYFCHEDAKKKLKEIYEQRGIKLPDWSDDD